MSLLNPKWVDREHSSECSSVSPFSIKSGGLGVVFQPTSFVLIHNRKELNYVTRYRFF